MFVEAVSCKERSSDTTTKTHAQRVWKKAFLFYFTFLSTGKLMCMNRVNHAYTMNSFSSVSLPIQPYIFYQKLNLDCNVMCFFLQKKIRQSQV